MKLKNSLIAVFISALLLTLLFYKQGIGLNVLFFDILLLGWLFVTKQLQTKNHTVWIAVTGFIFTAIFTVTTYSIFSYFIHFLAVFILVGVLNYPQTRSIVTAYLIAWAATLLSIVTFINRTAKTSVKGNTIGNSFYKSRIFFVPVLIVVVFISIYSFANSSFGNITENIGVFIGNTWNAIFKNIDPGMLFTYLFCFMISIFLLVRYSNQYLTTTDTNASLYIKRNRQNQETVFGIMALKNEYKAAIFLLIILNILLLILNFLDIKNIWFGFEWNGENLKEFVHEGTYLLIISILTSIALVLYYFRRNLNFYPNNSLLKKLSYLWIFQNAILVISVAIRNFWYIEYYALAYKRIGVILFLGVTFYGLYTVFRKVQHKKSSFYLFKNNAMSIYIVLILSSGIPWDTMIAKYNFAHANSSYLHLNYLKGFSDKALPYLTYSFEEVRTLKENQNANFLPDSDISASEYDKRIKIRIEAFKKKWENKNLLAWNLAEYLAYKKLFGN